MHQLSERARPPGFDESMDWPHAPAAVPRDRYS
jgi:hypothetical protein